MSVSGEFMSFTDDNIDKAPDAPGVYQLDDAKNVLYLGSATASIRTRLHRHKNGHEGPCTQKAKFFKAEITSLPVERQRELLQEYKEQFGKLPACNDVIP